MNRSQRLSYIIWHSDLLTTRWSIALGSLLWAIFLAWPGVLFTPARTTYRLMAEIAPETVWALAFAIHTVTAIYSLLNDRRCRLIYFLDAMLGCTLWTVSTLACFASHWKLGVYYAPPAAMSGEVALTLASWWYLARWDWNRDGGK